ncbi:hypothetical protein NJBCHELONAE_31270 [Mycobacteroides chelonae]|nr:hypothetical protein NJBCHELONAE_31270 [Mycobacteroides chelonae]
MQRHVQFRDLARVVSLGPVTTYTNVTVTFIDGTRQKFTQATLYDNGALEVTTVHQFRSSSVPGVEDPSQLSWIPEKPLCTVTDSAVYAPHEWRSVQLQLMAVLCAVVFDPGNRYHPTSLAVVKNQLVPGAGVRSEIDSFLRKHVNTKKATHFRPSFQVGPKLPMCCRLVGKRHLRRRTSSIVRMLRVGSGAM